ncbi:hypothetical protein OXPF_27690 [Oxobacter pfennigii]|uniref:DUF2357 domain-containing protein n=1 Tax=Oxobacter pfennigii TaxID=36849 RepID=A0A0N8NSY5_9CLOT|nr:hypothetical protein [Oxobacter pfennigii]KPU43328.1 hypothetical protein OXPF_27690 [Oxobacter pfennigii]
MDTLIKLIFTQVNMNNKYSETLVEIRESDTEKSEEIVGEFNEYNMIDVRFECPIKEAVLEIDSSISLYPVKVKPGQNIMITEGMDSSPMLTPGYYELRVILPFKTFERLYFIKPATMTFQSIINLRDFLDSIHEGLSQNIYVQRISGLKNIFSEDEYLLFKIYNFIENNSDMLVKNIDSIIRNPITDIEKVYEDKKAYKSHSALTSNIAANKWIKKAVGKTIEILCDLEAKYVKIFYKLDTIAKDKRAAIKRLEYEYASLSKDKTIVFNFIKSKQNSIKFMREDVDRINVQSRYIKDILEKVVNIKSRFLYFMYETWLKDIEGYDRLIKPAACIFKDDRYYSIYEAYNDIESMDKKDKNPVRSAFQSKKTSKLFEYYVTYLVINILIDNGFKWSEGWLLNNDGQEVGDIPPGEIMKFYRNNIRCEVAYEKEVAVDYDIISKNTSGFVRINARHYTPDIRIAFYNMNSGLLITAFIIEVKCCRSRYIYSSNGPTNVIEQVKDYCNLGYYDKNSSGKRKTRQGVIEEVLIVYPRQNNPVRYEYDDLNISFIQVEAAGSKDLSRHYGYNKLRIEVEKYIEAVMNLRM